MLILDYETYSEAGYIQVNGQWKKPTKQKAGIGLVGARAYAEHPSTYVISLDYIDDEVGLHGFWTPDCPWMPVDLFEYVSSGRLLEAHNSYFEYCIWNFCCVPKYGWPQLPLHQLRCSAAKARNWGLPGALKAIGEARDLPVKKDPRGEELIQKLCIPGKKPGTRSEFNEFYEYNAWDTRAEKTVSENMPEMSEYELQVWQLDQRINDRGVLIDVQSLKRLQQLVEWSYEKYLAELSYITNGLIDSASKTKKIIEFLAAHGIKTKSVDKEHVEKLLERQNLPPVCRRVLEIKALIGGLAVKKLWSIEWYLSSGNRLRGLYGYCGAERTGRFASYGPQVHNMKGTLKDGSKLDVDQFLIDIYDPSVVIDQKYPDLMDAIGTSVRGLQIASPGMDLISTDFSAIEAVVIACLAGEQWRIDVFNGHGKIYEESAARGFNVPLDEILNHKKQTGEHHPLRKKGKVRELANGYGGWINANKRFGATGTDEEIKADILKWRSESQAIVEFWGGQWRQVNPYKWEFYKELYGLEGTWIMAMLSPNTWKFYREIGYFYDTKMDVMYCRLPSNRLLTYHYPRLRLGYSRLKSDLQEYKLFFKKWNTDRDSGPLGWVDEQTYAGKLAENVTQATAGEILKYAMLTLDATGVYKIVMHTHDEITSEVPEGVGSVEEYERLVMLRPPWASWWPIKASGGWRGKRNRKG